ncbi:MAG: hypothetical protein Q4C35_01785 [Eubacteriales bacterium]|nr:hypothetical protein [Eubacteriales bacterium]
MVATRRIRIRRTNRLKCLACYLVCFALPPLWQLAGLWLVYPYKLAATAPNAAAALAGLVPLPALKSLAQRCTEPVHATPEAIRAAMAAREQSWLAFVAACALAAWLATLVLQLIWRAASHKPTQAARATQAAILAYRLNMLVIWLCNAAIAAVVWFFGARQIAGFGLWDALCYFGVYLLNPLAAVCVSRLAAPPTLSARHGFFKRL